MKLVVDVGNSRIKWAWARDRGLYHSSGVDRSEPADAIFERAWGNVDNPTEVLVCSVAGPDFDRRLQRWMEDRFGRCPAWFRSEPRTLGLVNGYTDYTRLGSDRWAALLGARGCCSEAVGVIDCGTAFTLDVVDAHGRHRGGLITAGLDLARRSLLCDTANIAEAAPRPSGLLGRGTAECVTNGIVLGLAGALERWMAEIEPRFVGLTWIATGGAWRSLKNLLDKPIRHEPDLVLKGLVRMLGGRR